MRRLLFVLAFGVLSWFGMGEARALTPSEAMDACAAYDASYSGTVACTDNGTAPCVKPGWATTYPGVGNGIVCGMRTKADSSDGGYVSWVYALPACTAGGTFTAQTRASSSPSSCRESCTVTWSRNGAPFVIVGSDGVPVSWQAWSGVGAGGPHCEQAPDTDGDGIPDTVDSEPTNPEENTDSDGDGIGDNNDAMPDDPTNGEDTGPGDETDNVSSGGGTCASPPTSTGDAIAAQIAYQTWATRCAVEKLNGTATTGPGIKTTGSGGGGTDMTATNTKLDGIKDGIDGLTNIDGASETDGLGDGSGEPEPGSVMKETEYLADGFDMSGFGWGNSCPAIPSFTVRGHTIQLDPDGKFCDFMTLGGWFVLIVMSLKCLRMLGAA